MNVVDTSGWIESIVDAPNADFFRPSIIASEELVVPTISIFEVYRVVLRLQGEESASESIGMMTLGQVVDLDTELAAAAARLAHEEKLAMADAIILATARPVQRNPLDAGCRSETIRQCEVSAGNDSRLAHFFRKFASSLSPCSVKKLSG